MFSKKSYKYADINMVDAVLNMDSVMTCAFLAGSLCDCFNIFTKLFINNILRDRVVPRKPESVQAEELSVPIDDDTQSRSSAGYGHDGKAEGHAGNSAYRVVALRSAGSKPIARLLSTLTPVIYFPIHCISNTLIFSVCLFFPEYGKNNAGQDAKKFLRSGNMDALINISCYYATYLITQYAPAAYKEKLYIFFLLASSLSLLSMTVFENRTALYLMYLSTSTLSKCAHSFTKIFLISRQLENNLVVACYISETALHVTINRICKLLKANSLYKARFYGYFGLCIFTLILCIKLIR